MAEKNENPRVVNLMSWVRMLLPVTIAALGWYIGQTVNGLEDRLSLIEAGDARMVLQQTAHTSMDNARTEDMMRRLENHELTFTEMVQLTEFMSKSESVDRRLDRIEDRLDTHIAENGNGTKE